MSAFSRWAESKQGSAVDRFALFCALLSIACVLGAHAMDRLAQTGALTGGAYPGVDYSATGSIPDRASATRLDPCVVHSPSHWNALNGGGKGLSSESR